MTDDSSLRRLWILLPVLALALGALFASGCAGTAASVRPAGPGDKSTSLDRYRDLSLQVTRSDGIDASQTEIERITRRIIEAVWAKQPDRFKEINSKTPVDPAAPMLDVTVQLTRYEKGSPVARAMLAGLGRIHIDARVTLKDRASAETLATYEISKTFAWGGIYGATTGIEDVELGFAEGVAAVLLGRQK